MDFSTYEVATACALAIGADKLICIIDGPILDEAGRHISFLTLQEADMLIRERAKQCEIAANYVKVVGKENFARSNHYINNDSNGNIHPQNGKAHLEDHTPTFQNGVGFSSHHTPTFQNGVGFGSRHMPVFQNGVGFGNGNGLWSCEQGFAIGGERNSHLNGHLSELAAAAFVCRVNPSYTNIPNLNMFPT